MKTRRLFDEPYSVGAHELDGKGVQRLYAYENGYGASVVRFMIGRSYGSYTNDETEWELAVLSVQSPDPNTWGITYETPITNDVLGHLSENEVEATLRQIANLPPPSNV